MWTIASFLIEIAQAAARPESTGFSVFKRFIWSDYLFRVAPDDRIRELAAQLFRAENPDVIDYVAAELHLAIDEYVRGAREQAYCLGSRAPIQSSA